MSGDDEHSLSPGEQRRLWARLIETPKAPLTPAEGDDAVAALQRISAALKPYADAAQAGDEATERAKQFANLRARAARAGVELRAVDDAGRLRYVCVKWAETASFANLAEVSAWLDRIDGGKP